MKTSLPTMRPNMCREARKPTFRAIQSPRIISANFDQQPFFKTAFSAKASAVRLVFGNKHPFIRAYLKLFLNVLYGLASFLFCGFRLRLFRLKPLLLFSLVVFIPLFAEDAQTLGTVLTEPHAGHVSECTSSNESGQAGSPAVGIGHEVNQFDKDAIHGEASLSDVVEVLKILIKELDAAFVFFLFCWVVTIIVLALK